MAKLLYTFAAVPPGESKAIKVIEIAKTKVHLFEAWARPVDTTWANFKPSPFHFKAQITSIETQGRQNDWVLDTGDERVRVEVKNTGGVTADIDLYYAAV